MPPCKIRRGGGKETEMIKVMRLNGEALYLNYFQIELIECIPDTKIKMMNGEYYIVRDSVESIERQIQHFINGCLKF